MRDTSKALLGLIDNFYQEENDKEGRRTHLGASIIGNPCARQTYYNFRWAYNKKHSGRMLRLFERGHLEEYRFVHYLRSIGLTVYDLDPVTGKQWRIKGHDGHFGGSLDGLAYFPRNFSSILPIGFNFEIPCLTEFKTASDSSWKWISKHNDVSKSKEEHWGQICTYGYCMGLDYVIYMVVNKNNDDLHIEFKEIDKNHGKRMYSLAHNIVGDVRPPMREYAKKHYKCNMCDFKKICANEQNIEKNCRSCVKSRAIPGGIWHCTQCQMDIPKDFIEKGCDFWIPFDND